MQLLSKTSCVLILLNLFLTFDTQLSATFHLAVEAYNILQETESQKAIGPEFENSRNDNDSESSWDKEVLGSSGDDKASDAKEGFEETQNIV